ncbi:MAG: BON domain-containing protein [Methyloprofundus sp.]|nr:BON domain-containing protein [Methyloprofundus sp.]MDT8426032.1 BON domain-containing protein [Methyloprofundus sp.]
MKLSLALFLIFCLTGCSSLANSLAELTGLSFLHDRRSSVVIALDENIEDSAIIQLHALDDVKEHAHFNITSYNGKVLVTGEAESEAIREKIIANIRIISGVKLVHNEMVVAPISTMQARSEDVLITIKVKDALTKIKGKPGFDATRVKVITERKVVYLMGIVHEEEGVAAAKVVQNVADVSKIVAVFEYIDYAGKII